MSRNAINELYKRVYGREASEAEKDYHARRFGAELDTVESSALEREMRSVMGEQPTQAETTPETTIPQTFVDEITTLYADSFGPDRVPTQEEIKFYADTYGTDTISEEEKARFQNAVRLEKAKDTGFARDVTDFFLRTVGRVPTQAEQLAYADSFKKDEGDGSYVFDRAEQDIARQNLLAERQQKFGLGDQIDALYKSTFGTAPDPASYGEAEQFFQKIGQYGTDPRTITARDAQKFKEQVVTPRQRAAIPINLPTTTNLPTTFLTPNVLDQTGGLSNVAITGGVSPLPKGAPTTTPVLPTVEPATDEEKVVTMQLGGDPVVEMMRQRDMQRASRAREDLNRLMGRNQTQGFENGGEVKKKLL